MHYFDSSIVGDWKIEVGEYIFYLHIKLCHLYTRPQLLFLKNIRESSLHTTDNILKETEANVSYYLQIYENTGTIIGKIVDKSHLNQEIARVYLGLAEELKDPNIYYPIRSDVIEGYQKLGIGGFLYDRLIQYLWDKNALLVSGSLNSASRGLWESLRKQGRVSNRKSYMGFKYAMEAFPREN